MILCASDLKQTATQQFKTVRTSNQVYWLSVASNGGGGGVTPPALTPLFLKSDDSNFVQNYFGVRLILCDKKIRILC